MSAGHDELRDLVATYALDATGAEEARSVEEHLRDCPRCREELAGHRETAALLAHTASAAPEGVWERIAHQIGSSRPDVPPLSLTVGDRRGRPSRARWAYRALATAAAAVIAVMGVAVVHDGHQISHLNSALAAESTLQRATAAALDPAARKVAFVSWSGKVAATAAILPDGSGYLMATGMKPLPASRTYQLWSMASGSTSAGLLGSRPWVVAFRLPPGAKVLAITDEPMGGSPQPTGSPVASASV